jgi:hypothetical protein
VLAAVGEVGGPGELVEFFVVDFFVFGGEVWRDLEADAAAGGGELAVGGAEDGSSESQDEVVFAGVGIEEAFFGAGERGGEVVGGGEGAAEEHDAVEGVVEGEFFGGEDGEAGAAGLCDEVNGAAGVGVLVGEDFIGDIAGAAAVAVDAGEVGEVAAGEGESPVEDADLSWDAAVGQAVAHTVGEDGFGFDAGEDEGEAMFEECRVEGAGLNEPQAAADPEGGELEAQGGVVFELVEEVLGAAGELGGGELAALAGNGEGVGEVRHEGLWLRSVCGRLTWVTRRKSERSANVFIGLRVAGLHETLAWGLRKANVTGIRRKHEGTKSAKGPRS